jgi:hypothetical protein
MLRLPPLLGNVRRRSRRYQQVVLGFTCQSNSILLGVSSKTASNCLQDTSGSSVSSLLCRRAPPEPSRLHLPRPLSGQLPTAACLLQLSSSTRRAQVKRSYARRAAQGLCDVTMFAAVGMSAYSLIHACIQLSAYQATQPENGRPALAGGSLPLLRSSKH